MSHSWFRSALLATLPQARCLRPNLTTAVCAVPRVRSKTRPLTLESLETRRLLAADSDFGFFYAPTDSGSMPTEVEPSEEIWQLEAWTEPAQENVSEEIWWVAPEEAWPGATEPEPSEEIWPEAWPGDTEGTGAVETEPAETGPPETEPAENGAAENGAMQSGAVAPAELTFEVFAIGTSTNVSEIYEGQGISVTVTLTGGSPGEGNYVDIYADADFDGKIDDGGYGTERRGREESPDKDGKYRFYFYVRDDGPSPGNGTPSDSLTIYASHGNTIRSTEVMIKNVAPRIVGVPTVSQTFGDFLDRVTSVIVPVFDPGDLDQITVAVTWSDNTYTEGTRVVDGSLCGDLSSRSIEVTRVLAEGEVAVPVSLQIWDDDGGRETGVLGDARFNFERLDVARNDDDDDQSGMADLTEWLVQGEDDLRELDLSPLLRPEMTASAGEFYFSYDPARITVWDTSYKLQLILPRSIDPSESGTAEPPSSFGIPYTGQRSVYVEGMVDGLSSIVLSWVPNESLPSSPSLLCAPLFSATFGGSVEVMVWSIDLDIDSDNDNGFNFPENDAWEEYLEDNEFGIGKLIYPNASHFTPTRLRLAPGLDAGINTPYKVRFDYKNVGKSGIVRLWNTFEADPNRISDAIGAGGNMVMASAVYDLSQLKYDRTTGGITIWIETTRVFSEHSTKKGVEDYGKPDDRIEAVLVIDGENLISDEVKYMSVDINTFYPNLQAREEMRNAIASDKIYALAEDAKYALKLLSPRDLMELGVPRGVVLLFETENGVPGFKAGVYRDHISGKFIVAFAGTDDGPDIVVDIWQGLGGFTEQYRAALNIGRGLADLREFRGNAVVTGHSLGGGLASAAAVGSGFHADTFNAAGLTRSTLQYNEMGERIAGNPLELSRYDNAEFGLIDAYFLDYDILSFVQDYTPLQNAIGKRIEMDGPLDLKVGYLAAVLAPQFASGAGWLTVSASLGNLAYLMGLCHVTHYYHYGLMVAEATGWDIYGYENF